jgi:DNA-binding GntR family transcriptional regulator
MVEAMAGNGSELPADPSVPDIRGSIPRATRRLDSSPLAAQVYEALRDAVAGGAYPEGTQLVQDVIAEQLGVSRTPVRDALIRLAHDGLITAAGVRGYMVTEPPASALTDIYDVRALLEPYAACAALDHMSEAAFQHLEVLNQAMRDQPKKPASDYFELNRRFHLSLVERCTNQLALRILKDIWDSPRGRQIWTRHFDVDRDIGPMTREHEEVVAAARRRDPEQLSRLLAEHLRSARMTV